MWLQLVVGVVLVKDDIFRKLEPMSVSSSFKYDILTPEISTSLLTKLLVEYLFCGESCFFVSC